MERATGRAMGTGVNMCNWSHILGENGYRTYGLQHTVIMRSLSFLFLTLLLNNRKNLTMAKYMRPETFRFFVRYFVAMHIRIFITQIMDGARYMVSEKALPCDVAAVFESLVYLYELEVLTHICIERFVVARYVTKGWPIPDYYYTLFLYLPIGFAVVYSVLPHLEVTPDVYGYDFSCETCTSEMVLPESNAKYIILFFFFLRSLKPVMIMAGMLGFARDYEEKYTPAMRKIGDIHFTDCVAILAGVNVLCWVPLGLIRAKVLLTQIVDPTMWEPCPYTLKAALMVFETSPVISTILIWYFDYDYERQHLLKSSIIVKPLSVPTKKD